MAPQKTQAWGAIFFVFAGLYVLSRCTDDTVASTGRSSSVVMAEPTLRKTPHRVDVAKLDRLSTQKMREVMTSTNATYGDDLFRGGIIEDGRCVIRIDGNDYEAASEQDKSLMTQLFVKLCVGSYVTPGRHVPADGIPIRVYNLAGDSVYDDTIVKSQ